MGGGAVDNFRIVYRRGAAPAGQRPEGAWGARRGPRKAGRSGGLPPSGPVPSPSPSGGGGAGREKGRSPRLAAAAGEARSTSGGPAPQRKSPGAERHTDGAPAPPAGAGRPPTPRGGGGRPNRPPLGRLPARHAEAAGGGDPAGGPDDGRPAGAEEGRPEGARTGADGGPAGAGTQSAVPPRPQERGRRGASGGAGGDTGGGGRRAARPDERARDGAEVRGHGPELPSEEWPNKGPRRPRPTPKAGATGDRPHTTDARGAGRVARGAPAPGTGAPRTAQSCPRNWSGQGAPERGRDPDPAHACSELPEPGPKGSRRSGEGPQARMGDVPKARSPWSGARRSRAERL